MIPDYDNNINLFNKYSSTSALALRHINMRAQEEMINDLILNIS